ncbi:hypothetical protein QC761_511505 [Podospora bellae-mahoneyi]|uniref:Uncharacterized protein n=1 Tax=Podospora bellae-mahoneyi TaxID=2093777 RepID=A0ABR0FF61_9PEZI|nr:hypothetical protein QC761_511505 [Podospora bellae-mahoneyi]
MPVATENGEKNSGDGGGKKEMPMFKCICYRCSCEEESEDEGNTCIKCLILCYWGGHPRRKLKRSTSCPAAAAGKR